MELFIIQYLLNNNDPCFSPDLNTDNEQNFLELINSLLKDIVEMGSCMERIADDYPPYNVKLYL